MISINFNHIKSLRDVHAMGRRVSRYQISWDTVQLTNEPGGHLSIIFSPPSSPFSWLGFHSLPTALIGWPRAWESLQRGKLPNNDGLAYYPTQWAHHQACSCSVATAENQNPAETPKEIIPDCGDVCHPVRQRIHAVGDDGEDDIWKQNHSPSQPREEIMMALLNNWVEALWPHRSCGAAFLNLPFFTGFFKKIHGGVVSNGECFSLFVRHPWVKGRCAPWDHTRSGSGSAGWRAKRETETRKARNYQI